MKTKEQFEKEAEIILSKAREESKKVLEKYDAVVIPDTKIIPSPMKIFTVAIEAEEYKTKSGIILPTKFDSGIKEGEQKTQTRYLVVSIGDIVKEQTFNGKRMEVGDELIYMDIPDAVKVEIPIVIDLELLGRTGNYIKYTVFDVMEIAGIIKREKYKKN